ncbi:MAG: hypothetical protein ABDH20_07955 [Thermus sp.]
METENLKKDGEEKGKPSKKEVERETLRQLRTKIRLKAAELLAEGKVHQGVVVALGAAVLGPKRLESLLSRLEGDTGEAAAWCGLQLARQRKPLKGSWPGGHGWHFLQAHLKGAAAQGQTELTVYLARISLSAPLFLAATAAAAVDSWGMSGLTEKCLKTIDEKAAPLAAKLGLEEILGPKPREREASGPPQR